MSTDMVITPQASANGNFQSCEDDGIDPRIAKENCSKRGVVDVGQTGDLPQRAISYGGGEPPSNDLGGDGGSIRANVCIGPVATSHEAVRWPGHASTTGHGPDRSEQLLAGRGPSSDVTPPSYGGGVHQHHDEGVIMVTTDTDRALDHSGFTGRKRSHFESLARRRSVVMASRLVAGDEPDAVTLYRDLSAAFDERAPRRSQALLVRATTLAGAYVNRWAPTSPWVLDSVLLADGTKQPGHLVDFATFARALVWTSRGRFRVDVLSAAPSPHAVRAERVSGRTRDTVAAARSLFGDALEVVRLVNASFPTLCEPVFEVSK